MARWLALSLLLVGCAPRQQNCTTLRSIAGLSRDDVVVALEAEYTRLGRPVLATRTAIHDCPCTTARAHGGEGEDRSFGGRGEDRSFGGGGEDRSFGGEGEDRSFGGRGEDRTFGGGGEDRTFGGGGEDRSFGGGGEDRTFGGGGEDRSFGGRGEDRSFGGAGEDRSFGGASAPLVCRVERRCPDSFVVDGASDLLLFRGAHRRPARVRGGDCVLSSAPRPAGIWVARYGALPIFAPPRMHERRRIVWA